jgi:hypothetical protein
MMRDREILKGYVTTLSSVTGRSETELEERLGFNRGSLGGGYYIYALAAPVSLTDFEWKDQTAYSDGWHFDPSITPFKAQGDATVYGVQRQDELRAHLGKIHDYDEAATDRAIDDIMRIQVAKLNVRIGNERIVKVISKSPVSGFPASPFRRVPQWNLKVLKAFDRIRDAGSALGARVTRP